MAIGGNGSGRTMSSDEEQVLSCWIANKIGDSLDSRVAINHSEATLSLIKDRYTQLCQHAKIVLPEDTEQRVLHRVVDEIVGLGPLEPLILDDTITEIMVNGPQQVYVERQGKVCEVDVQFQDNRHVLKIVEKIARPLGREISRRRPMVDARLADGSRVNAVIPPCSVDGPCITIRKFGSHRLTVEDYIRLGSITEDMAEFLRACVVSKLNIVIAGGTGSGKTTLLNILSSYIPEDNRIVTIEDAAELHLNQRHVVRLETAPAEMDGTGRVTIRDLVTNALRMRPERIVVGECRGGEALDMLQAMNTGHDGSLTTVHANSPRDTLTRLETLVLMAGMDLPLSVIRRQIASAIDLVVQQVRFRDGSRKITHITEVQGMEGEAVILQDVFVFEEQGEENGKVVGQLRPTGIPPRFLPRLALHGSSLPPAMFLRNGRLAGQR
jgi:pilus assembly protein CpaF